MPRSHRHIHSMPMCKAFCPSHLHSSLIHQGARNLRTKSYATTGAAERNTPERHAEGGTVTGNATVRRNASGETWMKATVRQRHRLISAGGDTRPESGAAQVRQAVLLQQSTAGRQQPAGQPGWCLQAAGARPSELCCNEALKQVIHSIPPPQTCNMCPHLARDRQARLLTAAPL